MTKIKLLDKETIDKIAAGEVVERPVSVVKELVENAIDAGATAVTVEIKNGGIDLIRVTDNGCGIAKDEVETAFLPHATSKIRDVTDLDDIATLGFRGEALPSIAAVAEVELITKEKDALLGTRFLTGGSGPDRLEEIGAPDGSTFLVRNLFFRLPARKKFLKTAQTEAGYIQTLLERIALSHPAIAFKFILNGQLRLSTSGNDLPRDIIYHIYGREIAGALLPVEARDGAMQLSGYIAKPVVTRGNRNYENYFVNGRYVKSNLISKGIEDAYRSYLMQHQYPFTVLSLTIDGQEVDVNVHPQKTELRFANGETLCRFIETSLRDALSHKELIPQETQPEEKTPRETAPVKREVPPAPRATAPEPFETRRNDRLAAIKEAVRQDSPYEKKYEYMEQQTLPFLSTEARAQYRVLGQAFLTYWIVEWDDKLFLIDQHAAHEKVIFERLMKRKSEKEPLSQQVSPPVMLTLSLSEETVLQQYLAEFTHLGFTIEPFGGREYALSAVPADIYGLDEKQLFIEMLDELSEGGRVRDTDVLYMKLATMSCKAAIKGGDKISRAEFEALLNELMSLENPYHCPHGRPTIITMSKAELEKRFKRVL